jgi:hypothetical protein
MRQRPRCTTPFILLSPGQRVRGSFSGQPCIADAHRMTHDTLDRVRSAVLFVRAQVMQSRVRINASLSQLRSRPWEF